MKLFWISVWFNWWFWWNRLQPFQHHRSYWPRLPMKENDWNGWNTALNMDPYLEQTQTWDHWFPSPACLPLNYTGSHRTISTHANCSDHHRWRLQSPALSHSVRLLQITSCNIFLTLISWKLCMITHHQYRNESKGN